MSGMDSDYGRMMATAEQVGLRVISDDWCCKLLAWLFVYGGGNESVVLDNKLFVDIMIAQTRLNIKGGERPVIELVLVMNHYVKEIGEKKSDWIADIENKYGVKSRE